MIFKFNATSNYITRVMIGLKNEPHRSYIVLADGVNIGCIALLSKSAGWIAQDVTHDGIHQAFGTRKEAAERLAEAHAPGSEWYERSHKEQTVCQ